MSARRRLISLPLILALLAGCADIPGSGGVTEVDGSRSEEQQPVLIDPPGPSPDATPVQIVRGFVDAMRAFPVSTDKATQFLTDEAAAGWRPQRQTVIYDELSVNESSAAAVQLSLRRTAVLDARGSFTPITDRLPDVEPAFSLQRVDGQWRIDNPPDALYVSDDFFREYFVPVSLYFLDLSGTVLLPDPVYLPEGEQLATSLVRGLLEGPTSDLDDQVLTSVPPSTPVDVSVPVRADGVAEVGLSGQALTLSGTQRQRLAAQLVWTLQQVPGIVGVRILTAGVPLDIPGAGDVQSLNAFTQYAPFSASTAEVFALRARRLVVVSPTGVSRFDGIWTEEPQDLADFDVDRDYRRLGGVTLDRSQVVVGPASGQADRGPQTLLRGGRDLTDPTWDRNNRLWVVEHRTDGSRMLLLDPSAPKGSRPQTVSLGPLDRSRVDAFALSPDGLRFAAVARSIHGRRLGPRRVMLGTVHMVGDTRTVDGITDVHELLTATAAFEAPRDVGWIDSLTVSVLARIGTESPQPYQARIDGSVVSGGVITPDPLLGRVGATTLATGSSPESPTYVGTRRGQLWYQDPNRQWLPVSRYPLLAPDYPG